MANPVPEIQEPLLKPGNNPGKQLRQLLQAGKTLPTPGAFNAMCAKIIEHVGFPAVYVSGAGISNGLGGYPDVGLMDHSEMTRMSGYIARSTRLPTIADADTGFGEAINVYRAVQTYQREGLAGVHIEDQVFPKRCGHLSGKEVIPVSQMQAKIQAAVQARTNPDFLIIARVDSKAVYGYDDALNRSRQYLDAGAEMIFPEALTTPAEFQQFAADLRSTHPNAWLLANMTEFGQTPMISLSEFEAFGYNMVIYPMTAFRLMMKTIEDGLRQLMSDGSQEKLLSQMTSRADLYKLLHYTDYEQLDQCLVPHQFSGSSC